MGNIQANEEVIFVSEFIQFVESSKPYEFEIFRNLPIFRNLSIFKNLGIFTKINT